MDLFDLVAKISLDTKEYEDGIQQSKGTFKDFIHGFNQGFKEASGGASMFGQVLKANLASDIIVKGVGAAVDGVKKLASALPTAIKETAEYADNVDKMSQKMGLSAEAYQEWSAVMEHSGTSIDSLQASMKTLANAVERDNDAFKRLGITQKEIESMNNEELFSRTIEALQNVENETERTYLAGQLLGRGATELGALLNTSAEETQRMKDEVHKLGGVMSNEAVKAGARFKDSLQNLKTAIGGIKKSLAADFLPGISTVMDGLSEIFSGDANSGKEMIKNGIDEISNKLSETLPQFIETVGTILEAIGEAIQENLPTLMNMGREILTTIGKGIHDNLDDILDVVIDVLMFVIDGLIDALPQLIDAGVEIFIKIIEGLADALPEIVPKLADGIVKIIKALVDHLPEFINAAAELIKGIGQGILDGLSELFSGLGLESLGGFFSMLSDFWKDVDVETLANGIVAIVTALAGLKLVQFTADAVGNFKKFCDAVKGVDWSGFGSGLSNLATVGLSIGATLVITGIAFKTSEHLIKGGAKELAREVGLDEMEVEAQVNMDWDNFKQMWSNFWAGNWSEIPQYPPGWQGYTKEWQEQWQAFRSEYSDAEGMMVKLGDIANAFVNFQDTVSDAFLNVISTFTGVNLKSQLETLTQMIEKGKGTVEETVEVADEYRKGAGKVIEGNHVELDGFKNDLRGTADEFSNFSSNASSTWERTKEAYGEAETWFGETFGNVKENTTEVIDEIVEAFEKSWERIQEIFDPAKDWFGEKIKSISDTVEELLETVYTMFSEDLPERFEEIFESYKEMLFEYFDGFTDDLFEEIFNTYLGEDFIEWMDDFFEDLEEYFDDKKEKDIKDYLDNSWEEFMDLLDEYMDDLMEFITEGKFHKVIEKVKKRIEEIEKKFKQLVKDAKEWGADMIQNFIDGIDSKMPALRAKMKEVASVIEGAIGFSEPEWGPLSNFHTYAPDMMNLFAKGIAENTDVVRNQIAKSFDFTEFGLSSNGINFNGINEYGNGLAGAILEGMSNIGVDVHLEGDASQWLSIMERENRIKTRSTGYNALAAMG